MNAGLKQELKKVSIISSIFITLMLVFSSFLFFDFFKVETVKYVVKQKLESSNLSNEYKDISDIIEKQSPAPLLLPFVLQGRCEGKIIDIYMLRLNGKYGIHLGLFLYDPEKQDVAFSCLLDDTSQNPDSYGINQGTIEYWKEKIKALYS